MSNSASDILYVKPSSSTQDLVEARFFVNQILQDPLKLKQLSDRVYQLMREDLTVQQKRNHSYGGRY